MFPFHVNGRRASANGMTFVRRAPIQIRALIAVCLLQPATHAGAQTHTLSLNTADLPSMTIGLEGASALSRHFSVGASLQYSPLRSRDDKEWNRQRSVSLSGRYWPWNVFSGWWASAGLTLREWSTVEGFPKIFSIMSGTPGVLPREVVLDMDTEEGVVPRPSFPWEEPLPPSPLKPTTEGTAYGAGLSFGYSLMLSRSFNLDMGTGFWTGKYRYSTYSCPTCGKTLSSGDSWFILPYGVDLSLVWVF